MTKVKRFEVYNSKHGLQSVYYSLDGVGRYINSFRNAAYIKVLLDDDSYAPAHTRDWFTIEEFLNAYCRPNTRKLDLKQRLTTALFSPFTVLDSALGLTFIPNFMRFTKLIDSQDFFDAYFLYEFLGHSTSTLIKDMGNHLWNINNNVYNLSEPTHRNKIMDYCKPTLLGKLDEIHSTLTLLPIHYDMIAQDILYVHIKDTEDNHSDYNKIFHWAKDFNFDKGFNTILDYLTSLPNDKEFKIHVLTK